MELRIMSIILWLILTFGFFSETKGMYKLLTSKKVNYKIVLPVKLILSDTSLSLKHDNELVLSIVFVESKRILHVSFNGDGGSEGTLKIYSVSHLLIKKVNFELIKYPYYASVDITDILSGTYQVELTTKKGVHTCTLTVK